MKRVSGLHVTFRHQQGVHLSIRRQFFLCVIGLRRAETELAVARRCTDR
jgi:hypothetical protein